MSEAHVRIDEGVKRGPRVKPAKLPKVNLKPSSLETKARNEAGQFMALYTPELKARAIEASIQALECGCRIEEVADQLKVPRSTLYSWVIGNERAAKARTQFFDAQVAKGMDDMLLAATPLDLARAREWVSGWVKVAERRDPRNYGVKQEVTHNLPTGPLLTINVNSAAQQSHCNTINNEIDVTPKVIESGS